MLPGLIELLLGNSAFVNFRWIRVPTSINWSYISVLVVVDLANFSRFSDTLSLTFMVYVRPCSLIYSMVISSVSLQYFDMRAGNQPVLKRN